MTRTILTFFLSGIGLICAPAEAKTIATRSCLSTDCNLIEIRINIDAGADAGKPGAFGILATTLANDPVDGAGKVSYWTSSNGWLPLSKGSLVRPADSPYPRIPGSKEYVIFSGRKDDLCKLSRGFGFNVFAWHVGLDQTQHLHLMNFLDRFEIVGEQQNNFLSSVLFYEANKQRKVSLVYTVTCPSGK